MKQLKRKEWWEFTDQMVLFYPQLHISLICHPQNFGPAAMGTSVNHFMNNLASSSVLLLCLPVSSHLHRHSLVYHKRGQAEEAEV